MPVSFKNGTNKDYLDSEYVFRWDDPGSHDKGSIRETANYPVSVHHGQPAAYYENPDQGYAAPGYAQNNIDYSAPPSYDNIPVSQYTAYYPQNAHPSNQLGYSAPPQQFYDQTPLQNQEQFLDKGYYHNGVWYPPQSYQQQHQMNFISNYAAPAEYIQPPPPTGHFDVVPSTESCSESASARDQVSDINLLARQSESVNEISTVKSVDQLSKDQAINTTQEKLVDTVEKKEVEVQTTEMGINISNGAEMVSIGVQTDVSLTESQLIFLSDNTDKELKSNPKMLPNSVTLGRSTLVSVNSAKTTAMKVDTMKTVASSGSQITNVKSKSTSHSVGLPPVKQVESCSSLHLGPSASDFPPLSESDPSVALSRAAKNRLKEANRRESSSCHYALVLSNSSQKTAGRALNVQAGLRSTNERSNLSNLRQSQKPKSSSPPEKGVTTKNDLIQKTSDVPRNMLPNKEVKLPAQTKPKFAPGGCPLAKTAENKTHGNPIAGRSAAKTSNPQSSSSNSTKLKLHGSDESGKSKAELPSKKEQTLAGQIKKGSDSTSGSFAKTKKTGKKTTGSEEDDKSYELKQKLPSKKKGDPAAQTERSSTPIGIKEALSGSSDVTENEVAGEDHGARLNTKAAKDQNACTDSVKPFSSSSKSANRVKTKEEPQIKVDCEAEDELSSSTKHLSKSQKKKEKKKRSEAWKKENALFIEFFANFNDEILLNDVRKSRDDMNALLRKKRSEAGEGEKGFLDACVNISLYEHFLLLVKDPFMAFHASGDIPTAYKNERTGLGKQILEHSSRALLVDWDSEMRKRDFENFVNSRIIYHESKFPSTQRMKLVWMFKVLLYRKKSYALVEDVHFLTTLNLDDKDQERIDFQYLSVISHCVSPMVQTGFRDNWPTVTSIRESVETELSNECLQNFCDYIRRQSRIRWYGFEFDSNYYPENKFYELLLIAHKEGREVFQNDGDCFPLSNILEIFVEMKDPHYNQCIPYLDFLCKIHSTLIHCDVFLIFIVGEIGLLEGVKIALWAWFNKRV